MAYIVTDRTGRYLLSASYPGNKLTINPIGDNGLVVEKTTQIVPDRAKAHCILIDAANKHVYATSLGADTVMQWKFDPTTGTLSPIGPGIIPAKPGAGPRHLALHPSGRYLYLITETTDTIGAYAIDPPTGTLTELHFVNALPEDFKEQPAAADLHVTPDGRFLYGSERKTSTLPVTASTPTRAPCRRSAIFRPRRHRAASRSIRAAASCCRSGSIRMR